MSHVAMQKTKAGEPMFNDMACLQQAAEKLGLEIIKQSTYRWYNRHVGDYPKPEGIEVSDLGKNAEYVLRIKEPLRSELTKKYGTEPYEIGIVKDPNNPGCYVPIYDFWRGGYGLDAIVGKPLFAANDYHKVEMLCPKLKQFYDMACEAAGAVECGDSIEILTMKAASEKYPALFAPSQDTDTWVSLADTSNRVAVSQ